MNRQDKIKLLTDIQAGQATIDDLNPYKIVHHKSNGQYEYNGQIISEKEYKALRGTVIKLTHYNNIKHEQTAKN